MLLLLRVRCSLLFLLLLLLYNLPEIADRRDGGGSADPLHLLKLAAPALYSSGWHQGIRFSARSCLFSQVTPTVQGALL